MRNMLLSGPWQRAFEDVLRGIGGGLILGLPLLYTQEVWWLGETADPRRALLVLVLTLVPVALLVSTSGFRTSVDLGRVEVLIDTVGALAIGLLSAGAVLVVLQRITLQTSLVTAVQMIVFEGAPFALGAAVASEVFGEDADGSDGDERRGDGHRRSTSHRSRIGGTVRDLGAATVGAAVVSMAIAPTQEVPALASAIERPWMVLVMALSLAVTYAIVFVAAFSEKDRRRRQRGVLQHPVSETAAAYIVALVVSAALLWTFGNLDAGDPLFVALERTVIMAFPASVGGAAGRLLV
jgi:putative integral membrane protein (TIGR02587 family)